jgi:hypothetical protein
MIGISRNFPATAMRQLTPGIGCYHMGTLGQEWAQVVVDVLVVEVEVVLTLN